MDFFAVEGMAWIRVIFINISNPGRVAWHTVRDRGTHTRGPYILRNVRDKICRGRERERLKKRLEGKT